MVLCEISESTGSFLATFICLSIVEIVFLIFTSGPAFYYYYRPSNITFEKWQYKSNPKYPSAEKVRDEIVQMTKSMLCSVIMPTLSLELARKGMGQAFCGWGDKSLAYHLSTFLFTWIFSDFFEFAYHRLGHVDLRFWQHHKHHHVFSNPTPFSVIADEPVDQILRSSPLLFIPLLIPINMDLLFIQFGLFFYVYGVVLHSGYEQSFVSSHNPIINSSFQHYIHHARSSMNTPYHCGFFLKAWDQLFGTCYPSEVKGCPCAECARSAGERTLEEFQKVKLPDYTPLLRPGFWLKTEIFKIKADRE